MENEHQIRRPVDYGKEFHKSGMTLITDPRSDRYLSKIEDNVRSQSLSSLQKGAEEKT
jgi:hypothetical protein